MTPLSSLKPISVATTVKFDVLSQSQSMSSLEAIGYIRGLLRTSEKASLIFTELVFCRAAVYQLPNMDYVTMKLCQSISFTKGPLGGEAFIKLIQEDQPELSNENWIKQMTMQMQMQGINVVQSKEVATNK